MLQLMAVRIGFIYATWLSKINLLLIITSPSKWILKSSITAKHMDKKEEEFCRKTLLSEAEFCILFKEGKKINKF